MNSQQEVTRGITGLSFHEFVSGRGAAAKLKLKTTSTNTFSIEKINLRDRLRYYK